MACQRTELSGTRTLVGFLGAAHSRKAAWADRQSYAWRHVTHAKRERLILADLLESSGPEAPTLCEG